MNVWFEGSGEIDCSIEDVKRSLDDLGEHFVAVVRRMPGMTSVELVEQGSEFVTIRTNEGLMKRTDIAVRADAQSVVVELDEVYEAGSRVTATTHFVDEFTAGGSGVAHRTVLSEVEAPGLLGFFYRKFGSASTGNAFLAASKAALEAPSS